VSFKAFVSLLVFCLDDLSIDISGVLKTFTIALFLLVPLFVIVLFNIFTSTFTSENYLAFLFLHFYAGIIKTHTKEEFA